MAMWVAGSALLVSRAQAEDPNSQERTISSTQKAAGDTDSGSTQGRVEVAGTSGPASSPAAALKVIAESEDFEYRISIVEVEQRPVEDVKVAIEPFVDEQGRQYVPESGIGTELKQQDWVHVAPKLEPGGRKTLLIRAHLPETGSYTTTITPHWAGAARQKLTLRVVRERPALDLGLSDSAIFAQDGKTDKVTFSLSVRETIGRELTLNPPVLVSLVQLMGSDANPPTVRRQAQFAAKVNEAPFPESVTLSPTQSERIEFELDQFPGPGKYEATVRFTSSTTAPLEKTLMLHVRRGWFWAVFAIGIGVVLSWVIRWWVNEEQPRLQLLEQALRLSKRLKAIKDTKGMDEHEREVVAHVGDQLTQLLEDVLGGDVKAEALDTMNHRIAATSNYIALRAWIRKNENAISNASERLNELSVKAHALTDADTDLAALKELQKWLL